MHLVLYIGFWTPNISPIFKWHISNYRPFPVCQNVFVNSYKKVYIFKIGNALILSERSFAIASLSLYNRPKANVLSGNGIAYIFPSFSLCRFLI